MLAARLFAALRLADSRLARCPEGGPALGGPELPRDQDTLLAQPVQVRHRGAAAALVAAAATILCGSFFAGRPRGKPRQIPTVGYATDGASRHKVKREKIQVPECIRLIDKTRPAVTAEGTLESKAGPPRQDRGAPRDSRTSRRQKNNEVLGALGPLRRRHEFE